MLCGVRITKQTGIHLQVAGICILHFKSYEVDSSCAHKFYIIFFEDLGHNIVS